MTLRRNLLLTLFYSVLILCIKIDSARGDSVEIYLHARQKIQQPVLNASLLAAAQQYPNDYRGRVFELTANVVGMVSSGQQRTALLTVGSNSLSVKLSSDLQNVDWIDSGRQIRILVRVELSGNDNSLSNLLMVGAAPEYDVAQAEQSQRRNASRGTLSSRYMSSRNGRTGTARGYFDDDGGHPIAALSDRARAIYPPYHAAIRRLNTRLSEYDVDKITTSILYFSDLHQIDPRLIMAMIIAESGFDINSTSRTGAMGLGQLMPETARGLGVTDAYDPVQNIGAAVHILRGRLDEYGGAPANAGVIPANQIKLIMAAYNAGPGAVRRYHGVPPYKETQRYVAKVAALYKQMCGE